MSIQKNVISLSASRSMTKLRLNGGIAGGPSRRSHKTNNVRDSVLGFADVEIRKRVETMTTGVLAPACRGGGAGLMGSKHRDSARGRLFFSASSRSGTFARRCLIRLFVDVQTLGIRPDSLGHARIQQTLAPLRPKSRRLRLPMRGPLRRLAMPLAPSIRDHFVLNGRKLWITNGKEAEIFVLFANANPEAGYRGITAFIVEKTMEGFSVGKKENKLGIRASSTTELILEDCKVPKENVLGEVGKGYKTSIETLNEGRTASGADDWNCACRLDALLYTTGRSIWQASTNLRRQFQLPDMATVSSRGLMVYNAARMKYRSELRQRTMGKLYSSRPPNESRPSDRTDGAMLRKG